MRIPRLAITEMLQAMRWPGALGAVLLVAAAGWGAAVLRPAQEDLQALQAKVERLERRAAAVRSGSEAAPLGPAARRARFFAALPPHADLTRQVERIYAAAAGEQLALLRGEYTGAEVPNAGLVRYRLVLPVKGSYGQVQRFVATASTAVPGLVLDDLQLQRQNVADAQLDARVHLSLFLVK